MLDLAWYTGRRLSSIAALRASDILLSPEQVASALADAGREEYLAEAWPAAIRWSAEADKEDVEWIVPIPAVLVEALTTYMRSRRIVGGVLLFPAPRSRDKAVSKETCYYRMREAEKKAGLPHQRRGGWHAFRRAWATNRKHLPLQDVMAAGGWRDPAALQAAYQHADGETIRAVMEVE
jgi:integrase